MTQYMDILRRYSPFIIALYFFPFGLSLAGVQIFLADIFALASVPVFLYLMLLGKFESGLFRRNVILLFFIAYIIIASILLRSNFVLSFIEALQWFSLYSLLFLIGFSKAYSDSGFIHKLVVVLFLIAIFVAAYHVSTGWYISYKKLGNSKYVFGFLCLILFIYRDVNKSYKYLLILAVVLLFLSQERKSILAFSLVVSVYYLSVIAGQYVKGILLVLTLTVASAVAFYISWYGYEAVIAGMELSEFDLFAYDESEARWVSNIHRKLLISNGLDILNEHLVLGVGAKMLPYYMADYFSYDQLAIYTHNFMLDTAIEYGVVGVAILFGLYLVVMGQLYSQGFKTFYLALYALITILFAAVNSVVMIMFMLPLFIGVYRN
ncbi:O-antigen ligase family protein [Amphritea sp. HPY]|uniref:O-antigen ligase family protein n=1 Tax=Amphritea sp. HPY TaxID=3421652 RepID=UPI003D7EAB62